MISTFVEMSRAAAVGSLCGALALTGTVMAGGPPGSAGSSGPRGSGPGPGPGPDPEPSPGACRAVTDAQDLWSFFEAARATRVDVVALGDSNQLFGSHGWDHGWQKALAARYGIYATGLISAGENGGNGAGTGYTYQGISTLGTAGVQYSGAPADLNAAMSGSVFMYPFNYMYAPMGVTLSPWASNGIAMAPTGVLDVNAALRYRVTYGVFDVGGGSFRLACRRGEPPYNTWLSGNLVTTGGPALDQAVATLDLPAGARESQIEFRFSPVGESIQGPFLAYFQRVEMPSRTTGVSFTTLYARGGQSARDMAQGILTADDAYLSLVVREIRALQGPGGKVLFRINTGLNDRNETSPSMGPVPILPGDSAEALADNLRAMIERLRGAWVSLTGDNPLFLITISHPVDEPDDEELVAYRAAAAQVASESPWITSVDLTRLTTAAEMLANGWYQSQGADRNHLTVEAFEELSAREIDALRPRCSGDANGDGVVNFADITSVLSNFTQCAALPGRGDANGDSYVSFGDVTAVLLQFGIACP